MSLDLRKYAHQTNKRLIIGGIIILFIVGDGLIYFIYGQNAAFSGLICLMVGLFPLMIIWIILSIMGWVVKKAAE
jgi:hypothetical protein